MPQATGTAGNRISSNGHRLFTFSSKPLERSCASPEVRLRRERAVCLPRWRFQTANEQERDGPFGHGEQQKALS
jgi:hypothetical protein